MKGNVFSLWLKEFCALVFTQTVQAFILAIVLVLVAMSISISNGMEEDSGDGEQAAAVLAIVALTSLSNMEGLVKKIFGLESSVTDSSMKGGRGGILAAIAAMRMAKKAVNNIPKIASGTKGHIDASREKKKAKLDYLSSTKKQLDRHNSLHPTSRNSSSSSASSTGISSASNVNSINNNTELNEHDNVDVINSNTSSGGSSSSNNNSSDAKSLKARYDTQDKLDKIRSDYEDKLKEISKKRRAATKNIVSGIVESEMAVLGGSAGAIYGLATGDSPIKNAGIGIGVGDSIGKSLVDIPSAAIEMGIENKKMNEKISNYRSKVKKYEQEIDEAMRKFDASDI